MVMQTPMPTQCRELDITSLMISNRSKNGAKRKLPLTGTPQKPIRPILKGSLTETNEKMVWSGCWGLTSAKIDDTFPEEVIRAPFYFERTCTLPKSSNQAIETANTQDGYFSGYFCMTSKDPQTGSSSFIKHFENDILLRFRNKGSENLMEVIGSGENRFGKFLVEGSYNSESREMNCARNYLARQCKRKASSVKSELFPVKRSSRVKKPSLKYQELQFEQEFRKNSERKYDDFQGREELMNIVDTAIATFPALKRIQSKLQNFRVKSLEAGINSVELALVKINDSDRSQLEAVVKLIDRLKLKHQSVLLSPTAEENEPPMDSVLNGFDDLEELDPLCFDPCAEIPKEMSSPPIFDLKSAFENKISFKDLGPFDDPTMGEKEDVNESNTKLSDLKPLEDDVDFSDWSCLDAQTLRELNDLVEFSCPSKGG